MTLSENEIQKIDEKIEKFSVITSFDSAWNDFSTYVCRCLKIESQEKSPIKKLFVENIPASEKKFIAICLLRIFCLNTKSVTYNQSFQISVIKYFDNTLSDVYRNCGLKANSQGYEKQSQLSDYISTVESELRNHLSISSFSELNNYEYRFKKFINDKKNFDVIAYFLNGFTNDNYLGKVFRSINQYAQSNNRNKLIAYENATKEINSIISKANELNTKYSRQYIQTNFQNILEIITDDFSNCPINKPADLLG